MSRITSFRSINIPVAISHYNFILNIMDDRQTQNKSVSCISHRPNLIRKSWTLHDELMTCDKVANSEVDVQKLTYDTLRRSISLFVNCAPGQNSDLVIRIGDTEFLHVTRIACVGICFCYVLAISLVRMRRNNDNCAFGLKTAITTDFIGTKFWRFFYSLNEL